MPASWRWTFPAARERAVEARALATSLGDREAVLDAEILLGRIDIIDGNYESGMRDGMRAAREARDAGYESTGVTGYRNMALLAARIMDPQAAEAGHRARGCSTRTPSSSPIAGR